MNARRWLVVLVGFAVIAGVTLYSLPWIARHVAVARIHAVTGRTAGIDAVELSLLTGRFTVRGFRLAERDGKTPFVDVQRVDARVSLSSLLRGHLWIRELVVSDPTVRVVRLPGNELNMSDLLQRSETATRKRLDVTVDHFRLAGGTATLEDRALPEPRTWASEQMTIEARNISTLRDDGTAIARSVTAGTPVSVDIKNLRLYPIHLDATAKVEALDLTPARVYFPPNATFEIDRGRLTTTITVALDARDGLRGDATASVEDVVLVSTRGRSTLARAPKLSSQVTAFALRDGALQVGRFVADGTMFVRDPTAPASAALRPSSVRASIADLTWPATTPGRVDVSASIPGGGTLALIGTVRPPPAATQLSLRVANLNLATWAQFVPVAARVTGVATADLRMNEPFAAGIPARVQGTVAVNRLGVADARGELLGAQRIEASGLELQWPTRLVVRRVLIAAPRTTVERDRAGDFRGVEILGARDAPPKPPTTSPALRVDVGEIVVRDGALAWRDATVTPAARLDVTAIDVSVNGAGWPLVGPLNVRVALRPPGGGQLRVTGRVGVDPLTADVRVNASNAELAPYQPYVPTSARVIGAADLDLAVVVPSFDARRATVRGTAALARVDVRDGQRTVMRAERATATGLDVAWPERIAVNRLALARPWLLLERDEQGALPLRALFPPTSPANGSESVAVTVARIVADDGGLRVVDRAISPAFAVDVDATTLRLDGLSTVAAPPAKLDLSARVAGKADLELRGTIGAFDRPLRLDVDGELREFAVPRANSYLVNQVGWKSREGRLTAKLRGGVNGDALTAKTDIRVSGLQLVKAGEQDQAQSRIGLPLGTITALMKNRRGDINVSFPVGGRLSDPRFDFREAIWGAVRTVAINAITLPVSWIGRVRFSADSKIQRIEVDPLPFEPGTAVLTAEGQARVTRIKAFLDQLPEVRMAMTPVVSSRDVAEIRRRTEEPQLARAASPPSADGAALPRAAVAERTPAPGNAVPDLAERRVEAARAAMKQAGIDAAWVTETKLAERPGAESQIDLEILEPDGHRPSKVRDALRRFGLPVKGADD